MARDGCNFYFSFWAIFAFYVPPSSLAAQKIKIKKKEKNAWRNHHFTQYVYQKL